MENCIGRMLKFMFIMTITGTALTAAALMLQINVVSTHIKMLGYAVVFSAKQLPECLRNILRVSKLPKFSGGPQHMQPCIITVYNHRLEPNLSPPPPPYYPMLSLSLNKVAC